MAHSDLFPTDAIPTIVDQIARQLQLLIPLDLHGETRVELTEHLQLWLAYLHRAEGSNRSVELVVRSLDRWHHQIRINDRTPAFARSERAEGGWSVVQVFVSRIADRLHDAIDVVDALPGDPLVRLLMMPSHHIHALWLIDAGSPRVLPFDGLPSASLLLGRILTADDFAAALAKIEPVIGIQFSD